MSLTMRAKGEQVAFTHSSEAINQYKDQTLSGLICCVRGTQHSTEKTRQRPRFAPWMRVEGLKHMTLKWTRLFYSLTPCSGYKTGVGMFPGKLDV